MKKISTILLLLIAALCILPFIASCQEFDSDSWDKFKDVEELKEYSGSSTGTTAFRLNPSLSVAALKITGVVFSGNSPNARLEFSFLGDSIKTNYSNLDSAGITLAKEVQKLVQWRLNEKQHQIDSLTAIILKPNMPISGTATMEMHPWCVSGQTTLEMHSWISAKETPCLILSPNDTFPSTGAISISEGWVDYHRDSMLVPKTKTDTISVHALCTNTKKEGRRALVVTSYGNEYTFPYLTEIQVERTLEWETWNEGAKPDKNGTAVAINIIRSDWVIKSTRYLEPIEGCFQLIPIQND